MLSGNLTHPALPKTLTLYNTTPHNSFQVDSSNQFIYIQDCCPSVLFKFSLTALTVPTVQLSYSFTAIDGQLLGAGILVGLNSSGVTFINSTTLDVLAFLSASVSAVTADVTRGILFASVSGGPGCLAINYANASSPSIVGTFNWTGSAASKPLYDSTRTVLWLVADDIVLQVDTSTIERYDPF